MSEWGVARAGHSMMSCVKSHESTSLLAFNQRVSKLCKENIVFVIHLLIGEKTSSRSPRYTIILPSKFFPLSPADTHTEPDKYN